MEFISTQEKLPTPSLLEYAGNKYYLIKTKEFKPVLAMYCLDDNQEAGWYTSYLSKVFRTVTHWCEIEDELLTALRP